MKAHQHMKIVNNKVLVYFRPLSTSTQSLVLSLVKSLFKVCKVTLFWQINSSNFVRLNMACKRYKNETQGS